IEATGDIVLLTNLDASATMPSSSLSLQPHGGGILVHGKTINTGQGGATISTTRAGGGTGSITTDVGDINIAGASSGRPNPISIDMGLPAGVSSVSDAAANTVELRSGGKIYTDANFIRQKIVSIMRGDGDIVKLYAADSVQFIGNLDVSSVG